jgi:hypothetical protein
VPFGPDRQAPARVAWLDGKQAPIRSWGATMQECSAPAKYLVKPDDNITDDVFSNAEDWPSAVGLLRRTAGGWKPVTWHEFAAEVRRLAAGLIAAGVQPGDRVALMSRTRFEWTLLDYAILAAGGVVVPIYPTSSLDQVWWILSDSAATAVIVETDGHADMVAALRDRLPALAHAWQIGGSGSGGLADLEALGAGVTPEQAEERRKTRGAADLAEIVYTSGTTGRPKGCMLSHGNIVANSRNCMRNDGFPQVFNADASSLLFLPLAHSYAQLIQYGAIYSRTAGHDRIFRYAEDTATAYSQALDDGGPRPALRLKHLLFDRLVYGKLRAALGGREGGHRRQADTRRHDPHRVRRRDPRQGSPGLPGLLEQRGRYQGNSRRGRLAAHRRHRRTRRRGVPDDHRAQEGPHHHRGGQERRARRARRLAARSLAGQPVPGGRGRQALHRRPGRRGRGGTRPVACGQRQAGSGDGRRAPSRPCTRAAARSLRLPVTVGYAWDRGLSRAAKRSIARNPSRMTFE